MKKITITLPEDVVSAIVDEGQREFRSLEQQASYLLLTWSREGKDKRQKSEKISSPPVKMVESALPLVHNLG